MWRARPAMMAEARNIRPCVRVVRVMRVVETTRAAESTGGVLARRACGRGGAEDSHGALIKKTPPSSRKGCGRSG